MGESHIHISDGLLLLSLSHVIFSEKLLGLTTLFNKSLFVVRSFFLEVLMNCRYMRLKYLLVRYLLVKNNFLAKLELFYLILFLFRRSAVIWSNVPDTPETSLLGLRIWIRCMVISWFAGNGCSLKSQTRSNNWNFGLGRSLTWLYITFEARHPSALCEGNKALLDI